MLNRGTVGNWPAGLHFPYLASVLRRTGLDACVALATLDLSPHGDTPASTAVCQSQAWLTGLNCVLKLPSQLMRWGRGADYPQTGFCEQSGTVSTNQF